MLISDQATFVMLISDQGPLCDVNFQQATFVMLISNRGPLYIYKKIYVYK